MWLALDPQVEFVVQKCGTGAMIEGVHKQELDVIIALTEGLVADIAKGSDLRLLGTYVVGPELLSGAQLVCCVAGSKQGKKRAHSTAHSHTFPGQDSPLCWAVSSGKDRDDITSLEALREGTFGVSRYGSGSHLMAYVLGMKRLWNPQIDVNFKVVGNFEQLRDSVNAKETDAFMWDTVTTKPFHDTGEGRRIGDISTPWPCFMLAAAAGTVEAKLDQLQRCLAAVHEAATLFHQEKETIPVEVGLAPLEACASPQGKGHS